MTDFTREDIILNQKRGWFWVCNKCDFVVPDSDLKIFKSCGQCGSKSYRKMKVK